MRLSLLLSRAGTVIIGDNVVRKGRNLDEQSNDLDVVGVREYFELISSEPRLDTTAARTVVANGWDGFSITLAATVARRRA